MDNSASRRHPDGRHPAGHRGHAGAAVLVPVRSHPVQRTVPRPAGPPAGTPGAPAPASPALPDLHGRWLVTLTGRPNPPGEAKATCSDCVMCAGPARSGSPITFRPDVKCCSYVPHVSNFLAGRALDGDGARSVVDRIGRRAGVSPLGLGITPADVRVMTGAQPEFGVSTVVRCPHFEPGTQGCSIWQTRNAVCSTWFCRHERGAVGLAFWHAVRDLLVAVEERVARYCLLQADLPHEQADAVLAHRAAMRDLLARANVGGDVAEDATDPDLEHSDALYDRLWGDWAGQETQWFARCAEVVSTLDGAQLLALLGGDLGLVAEVRATAAATGGTGPRPTDLPDLLRLVPGPGSEATDDQLRLVGYSPFDPVVMPAALGAPLLHAAASGGTAPAADLLRDLPLDLLGRLVDAGVLVDADPDPGAADG